MDTYTRRLPLGVCARSVVYLFEMPKTHVSQRRSVQLSCHDSVLGKQHYLATYTHANPTRPYLWHVRPVRRLTSPSHRRAHLRRQHADSEALRARPRGSDDARRTLPARRFVPAAYPYPGVAQRMHPGLPPGVLNIVHGTAPTVNAICDDPAIRAISFVGGDRAGTHIYNRCAWRI
jgi:hypothetical protein